MANAIKTMIENEELRNKFSVNAFKAVNEVFNLDKLLEDTYKIYY